MKKTMKMRNVVVLLVVLILAMLISTLILNDNNTHNIANAASESANDSLTLTLTNDGTGYKVAARNKQIISVKIPEKYNGLPVMEIADNGFTNCANLKEVWVPHTIKRIGNNAFANCRNLENINGMPKVEYVGNNAFAMCTKLDNLILPSTINSLGSTILRNNPNKVYSRMSEEQMNALNAKWIASSTVEVIYGNELVLTEIADDNENLKGYSITMQQNLNTDVDFVLGDTYNGLPLLEIEQYAFYFSEFKSFTLKHGIIDPDLDSNKGFTPSETECDHTVNIKSGAFYGMTASYIDILVDVTFNDEEVDDTSYFDYENGHSIEVFSNSSVRGVTLPNNITYLPKSMFADCLNLREIKSTDALVDVNNISNNITAIGTDAFAGCTALLNLYMPNSVTIMGNSVFNNWGSTDIVQRIHFNDMYEAPIGIDGYDWNSNWLGTTFDNLQVQYKTISIVFDKDGGKEETGTNGVLAMYHQEMPEATAPEREYYHFGGYFTQRNGKGTQYYDENMDSIRNWDKKEETVLYAYWMPYTFSVAFDKNGGTGGSNDVIASYEQPMPSAIKPTKTGYRFLGYYLGNEPYYDENMNSTNNWNFAENGKTLTAKWSKRQYPVVLNIVDDLTDSITTTYDEPMPPKNKPTRVGYEFNGYFTQTNGHGVQYYNEDMGSVRNWDIDSEEIINLYAHWIQKNYTIIFDNQGGTGGTENILNIHFGDKFPTVEAPEKLGYEFKGYYAENGGIYYTNEMKPTQVTYNVDGDLKLFAEWGEPIEYTINYDLGGGKNNPKNPTSFTVNENFVLIKPTNKPLIFTGWTWNGQSISQIVGRKVIEGLSKDNREITIKANWTDTEIVKVSSSFRTKNVSTPNVKLYMNVAFSNNCTINVASTTESIDIYGYDRSYNINIVIDSESTNVSIHLHDITIKAHSDKSAISASSSTNLSLYTYNSVNIYGITQSDGSGSSAITCGSLTIYCANMLRIIGGDGKNGANGYFEHLSGERGGNAGAGVIASEFVNILCSNVTISAGSAGNGGDGYNLNFYRGEGGKGSKAVVGELIIMNGITDVTIIDSEDGTAGKGKVYVTPGHPGFDPDPVNPPIIIK